MTNFFIPGKLSLLADDKTEKSGKGTIKMSKDRKSLLQKRFLKAFH